MSSTFTQQQDSQEGESKHPPSTKPIEMKTTPQTVATESTPIDTNNKTSRSPRVLHSLSADPYAPYPTTTTTSSSTHHTLNLTDFPIPDTIDLNSPRSPLFSPTQTTRKQAQQPPLRTIASAPETYYNHS